MAKRKIMRRAVVVNELVASEAAAMLDSPDSGSIIYILQNGWVGYANMTNKELEQEWSDLNDEEIKIQGRKGK